MNSIEMSWNGAGARAVMQNTDTKQPKVRLVWLRKISSALLMVVGTVVLIRGIGYGIQNHLGLGPFIQTTVVGILIFGLGLARWRFWRDR